MSSSSGCPGAVSATALLSRLRSRLVSFRHGLVTFGLRATDPSSHHCIAPLMPCHAMPCCSTPLLRIASILDANLPTTDRELIERQEPEHRGNGEAYPDPVQ
ncbi:hypothetical protein ColLi_11572 [Colletotrichum liriopes]|uniref:Uncharacterized protein n=1 Tax=Colletotrichum liriopes TaxID=708192 RepID=A0AA37LXU5_9PEZI|nr:hypothetical protein ColLi_11572 [Colletotrichum liriopes]